MFSKESVLLLYASAIRPPPPPPPKYDLLRPFPPFDDILPVPCNVMTFNQIEPPEPPPEPLFEYEVPLLPSAEIIPFIVAVPNSTLRS
jgi:hypothetical protein